MALLEREYKVSIEPPIEEGNLDRWDAATKAFLEQVESLLPMLRAEDLEAMTKVISEVCHAPASSDSESALALRLTGWKFPSWQFDPEGPDGVVEGLPEVLKALGGSNFSKLNWLVSPNCYLDGIAPIEDLKRGDKERVLKEAEAVGVW